MPIDTKRLPVPDSSFSPYSIERKNGKEEVILVDRQGKRQDGRTGDQIRPMFVKTGVVSQAKGSSYIEMDQTKLICAVYGPREVTKREEFSMKGQLNCELKYATFASVYRRQHQTDADEKDASIILLQALEPAVQLDKFPKARMDVFVTVLQDDGGALGGAMTAASVALADAGIEMYDLVVGCSLRQLGSITLLDPVMKEEFSTKTAKKGEESGGVTVGLMPSLHQVSGLAQKGHMTAELALQGIQMCIEGCQKVYPVLQHCISKAVQEQNKQAQKTNR